MRPSFLVLAALLALSLANPQPALSKGKKPAEDESGIDEDYSRIQEDIIAEQKNAPESPEGAAPEPQAVPEPASKAAAQAEPEKETSQRTYPPQEAAKETPVSAPEGGSVHIVWVWQESRDCLWNLAKSHYKDPWKWKKIYLANRNSILNPAVIFPKQRIAIPPQETASE